MPNYVQTILESAESRQIIQENANLIQEAVADLQGFHSILTNYIAENFVEFLDENLEETAKNIHTFASFATKQLLGETAALYGQQMYQNEILKEQARTEFV